MFKRVIFNVVLLTGLFVQVAFSQTATKPSGSGTSSAPYQIATLDNLYWLTQNSSAWGAYFEQTADIDASTSSNWNGGNGFSPIGNSTTNFTGNYDGLGHTISGLTINSGSSDNIGMFGYVNAGSKQVDSLNLTGVAVTGRNNTGGLIGYNYKSHITDCSVNGAVQGDTIVGGLVGYSFGGKTISYCSSAAEVTGMEYVGGLAGSITNEVDYCYAAGNVTGSKDYIGGLVGLQSGAGGFNKYISYSFATGNVSGVYEVGGFVGDGSNVSNCYASGAVSGYSGVGGLCGVSGGGIIDSYATGSVYAGNPLFDNITNSSSVGGLTGGADVSNITANTNCYWDVGTSGQSGDPFKGAGYTTGETTSELQGTLPTGFSSTIWGTGSGLYPYLKWYYSATPQAVSGIAYSDAGKTAYATDSTAYKYVELQVDGGSQDTVVTGANGYYYFLLDSNTIKSTGSDVITYTGSDGACVNSATNTDTNLVIWNSTLIGPTSSTTYSSAASSTIQSQDASIISGAEGSNTTLQSFVSGLSKYGYLATGSGFSIDNNISGSVFVQMRANNADITVDHALTLTGTNTFDVDATDSVIFNYGLNVSGGGFVNLSAGNDYSLKDSATIEFTGGSASGAGLTINDTSYTLLYSMSDIQNINNNINHDYAMAVSIDGSGTSSWTPIGTNGSGTVSNNGTGFSRTFSGLGHTISNLTVDIGSANYAGLFGYSSGTIRNLGLDIGTVIGGGYTGGIAGENAGSISNVYSTVQVEGDSLVGGLIGENTSSGTVTNAYETGNAEGTSAVGGLVGENQGSLGRSYSSGYVGGTTNTGGLVGSNSGTVTDGYWNTQTSTQSSGSSGIGLSYAQMKQSSNFSGYDFTNSWNITNGNTYPFLQGAVQSPAPGVYPATPGGLTVTDSTSYGSISLRWRANVEPDFSLYRIYRGTLQDPTTEVDSVTTISDTTISDTGLANAVRYYYRITAVNSSGNESQFSFNVNAKAGDHTPPAAPQNLVVTDSSTVAQVSLSWSENTESDFAQYRVYESTSAGATTPVDTLYNITDTTITITGLPREYRYYFRLTAVDKSHNVSAYSNEVNVEPGVPQNFVITNSDLATQVSLSWSKYTGANFAQYRVYDDKTSSASNPVDTLYGISDTTVTITGLNRATHYFFQLTVVNTQDSVSSFSDEVNCYPGGNGSASNPFTIHSIDDLKWLSSTSSVWGKQFIQTADIDASSSAAWNGGTGFGPIGQKILNPITGIYGNCFTGKYNGEGHTIDSLTINTTATGDIGMFGDVLSGEIDSLGITNANIADSNSSNTGALVGSFFSGSIIYRCYSTGKVTGTGNGSSNYVGGLAGDAQSGSTIGGTYGNNTMSECFSTAVVTGISNQGTGGLIGASSSDSVVNCYATGAVTSSNAASLIDKNFNAGIIIDCYGAGALSGSSNSGLVGSNAGTITDSYWDTLATGQGSSAGGTGLSTSDLQGTLPTGFSSSVWNTGTNLYPYFKWQEIISGTAYSDLGVTSLSGSTVTAMIDGAVIGTATTDASGNYFIEAGLISSSGSDILAYTNGTSGGAAIENASNSVGGLNIYGSALHDITSDTVYSDLAGQISEAVGSNSTVSSLVSSLPEYYITVSNTLGYTVDKAVTKSLNVQLTSTGGNTPDITIADSITIPGSDNFTLNTPGSIVFDSTVNITGGGAVSLIPGVDYTFGSGGGIDFTGGSSSGASLKINGSSYTLLYSMSDVQNINNNLTRDYALATSLDASGIPSWTPIGTNGSGTIENTGNGFTATFAGLNHTISGLTVNIANNQYGGIFGYVNGTIRDLGISGGSVTGGQFVGALAGYSNGLITDVFTSDNVSGTRAVGGLVGKNGSGTMKDDYATGPVSETNNTGEYIGGLVGTNTGAIEQSFATGKTDAYTSIGGLAGLNSTGGTLTDVYATGAVTSDSSNNVGGLIGSNTGGVSYAYSSGAVTAPAGVSGVGGLVGYNNGGTVTDGFWDKDSSGQSSSAAGSGLTDSQMKDSANFSGFDFTNVWNIKQTKSYPYLRNNQQSSTPGVTPLPVELQTFTAFVVNNNVELRWKTATEVDCYGFEIERSRKTEVSSQNSEGNVIPSGVEGWTKVGFVNGSGSSNSPKVYSFIDKDPAGGDSIEYRLKQIDNNGKFTYSNVVNVNFIPSEYKLFQNYPNPFNPSTTVRFDLKERSRVTLEIYNILGQRIEDLNYGIMNTGQYDKLINMSRFASGVYILRIAAKGLKGDKFSAIKKMMELK